MQFAGMQAFAGTPVCPNLLRSPAWILNLKKELHSLDLQQNEGDTIFSNETTWLSQKTLLMKFWPTPTLD